MRAQSLQVIESKVVTKGALVGTTLKRILMIMEYLGDPFAYNIKILSLLLMLLRMWTL